MSETLKQLLYRHRGRFNDLDKYNKFLFDLMHHTKEGNKYYNASVFFKNYFKSEDGKQELVKVTQSIVGNALQGLDLDGVSMSYTTSEIDYGTSFAVSVTLVINIPRYNFKRTYTVCEVRYNYKSCSYSQGLYAYSNRFRDGITKKLEGFSDVKLRVRKDIKEILEILK